MPRLASRTGAASPGTPERTSHPALRHGPGAERDLRRYLDMLAGEQPTGRLLEIRLALPDGGMARRFIPAERPLAAASVITARARRTDVYIGVLLRTRRGGGREAVAPSHLTFVEIDSTDAHARLERFPKAPSMVLSSGTPGHLHVYWQLRTPVGVLELEQANRRLAAHLGGDLGSVDAARILRPCGSFNHKHTPPAPVELVHLDPDRIYDIDELVDGLPDAAGTPRLGPTGPRRVARHPLDQQLLAIPAADYTRALAGREPNRAGKIACPFHDDSDPSLQLYEDGTWYCYGCRIGGSIYDFAAALWNMDTKQREFLKLRSRLADELGLTAPQRPAAGNQVSGS